MCDILHAVWILFPVEDSLSYFRADVMCEQWTGCIQEGCHI